MTVHVDNQYIWQLWIKYVRSAQLCLSVGRWVRRFITSWLFAYSTLWHSGWSEQPLAFHSSAYQMCYSGCGLGCPAFEHRWWRKFPDPFVSALRSTHPSVQWVPGLSFGGKATGDSLTVHRLLASGSIILRAKPLPFLWVCLACSSTDLPADTVYLVATLSDLYI